MTLEEIQAALDALPGAMAAKGCIEPEAEYSLKSQAASTLWLKASDKGASIGPFGLEIFRRQTPTECFVAALAHIAAMPEPQTAALHRHMARLGEAVDLARADGIPDEYVNPVSLTIKAMSDNLLAAPQAAE
jgi:hypothetical protein